MNAVATAVKDFFFKRLPPLLPAEHMADLETISVMQVHQDFLFVFVSALKGVSHEIWGLSSMIRTHL